MNCEHCGASNPLSAEVCEHCNHPITAKVSLPFSATEKSDSNYKKTFDYSANRRTNFGIFCGVMSFFLFGAGGIIGVILCIFGLKACRKKAVIGLIINILGLAFWVAIFFNYVINNSHIYSWSITT